MLIHNIIIKHNFLIKRIHLSFKICKLLRFIKSNSKLLMENNLLILILKCMILEEKNKYKFNIQRSLFINILTQLIYLRGEKS